MTTALLIKTKLYEACLQNIEERISAIEERLASVEEARNNETKSSAGDKYETGRAMMQMEEEKSKAQLNEANMVRQQLSKIDPKKSFDRAEPGSLITTSNGLYFLSIGIGKVVLDDLVYFCVSPESPIGRLLRNKAKGDLVFFNDKKITIENIG